jgi:hypothetical protein
MEHDPLQIDKLLGRLHAQINRNQSIAMQYLARCCIFSLDLVVMYKRMGVMHCQESTTTTTNYNHAIMHSICLFDPAQLCCHHRHDRPHAVFRLGEDQRGIAVKYFIRHFFLVTRQAVQKDGT